MKTTTSFSVLLLAGCLTGCRPQTESAEPEPPAAKVESGVVTLPPESPQLAALAVEPVAEATGIILRLNARLAWNDNLTARVFSPFTGRVASILTEVGQPVAKGGALATIASPDLGQAQADARRAASDRLQAERTSARVRELFEHGAAPRMAVEAAEADLSRAQAEQQRALARLALYEVSGDTIDQVCPLKSPMAGIVVDKNLSLGLEVRPDQMLANMPQVVAPLFVVTDPSQLWVIIDASEADLPRLHPGQALTVHSQSFPDRAFPARIEQISEALDPITRTVKARAALSNPDRVLKAEMLVTVEVPQEASRSTAVPTKAVFLQGEKHYVFVEQGPGKFVKREVKIGAEHDGKLAVLKGVTLGQRVVSDGCMLLEHLMGSSGS